MIPDAGTVDLLVTGNLKMKNTLTEGQKNGVCTSTIIICHNHLFPSHAVGSPACQRPGGGHSLHTRGEMDSPLAMWMTKHWKMGDFSQYFLNSFNIDHYFPSIYPIENGYVIFWGLYFSM